MADDSEEEKSYQKFKAAFNRAMDEREADAQAKQAEEDKQRTESKKTSSILGGLFG